MPNTCDEPFVPLTRTAPTAGRRGDLRVIIVPQSGSAQPFRPLGPAAGAPSPAPHGAGCEPHVALQRDGDRVSAIQIQCACGQIIELACVYEAPPARP